MIPTRSIIPTIFFVFVSPILVCGCCFTPSLVRAAVVFTRGYITRARNYCEFCTTLMITRTRNFCMSCTSVPQHPGYGYSMLIPTRYVCEFLYAPVPQYLWNFCEFCKTSVSSVRLLLCTRSRNFCECFCMISAPVPGTSVSSV